MDWKLITKSCFSALLDMFVHTADVKLRPSSASVVLFIQLSQQSAVKWTCSSDNLASLDEVFNRRRTTHPQRWMMTLNCLLVSLPCILLSPQAPPFGCSVYVLPQLLCGGSSQAPLPHQVY